MAFATVADLEARWRPLTEDEQEIASTLLDDAAVMLASTVTIDPDDSQQESLLRVISCAMVRRAMNTMSAGTMGVTQGSITADVYSQSWTFSNPGGDLYLTKRELKALGVGAGFFAAIPPAIGGATC